MTWIKEVDDELYGMHPAMIYADELRATGLFARVTQKGSNVKAWRYRPEITDKEPSDGI
jgi:hypothetical protein